MDKNSLVAKLNKAFPGVVLESRRFGRSSLTSVWLEAQNLQRVASSLKEDSEFKVDWLENLSVVEFEKVFVVSYFVRSTVKDTTFVIRASAVPSSSQAPVHFPSVKEIWSMATPMEKEIEEMFGIFFHVTEKLESPAVYSRSSAGSDPQFAMGNTWEGFPLRKSYQFPREVMGISHSRPTNRSSQKKVDS